MYGNTAMAVPLLENIAQACAGKPEGVEVVLCPPFTLLAEVARHLIGTDIRLGAQDCHHEREGAFTGCISAAMLREAGCSYVITGHSERRRYQQETNAQVQQKARAAQQAGLIPVVCVGETLAEREAGKAEAVVAEQLRDSLPVGGQGHFLVAYEPVWAIGTGRVPGAEDIAAMHRFITQACGAATPVLYGGSVNAANARDILTTPGVSGVLVGGASLKAEEFCKIVESGV
jgi:triosephosphate isomerase